MKFIYSFLESVEAKFKKVEEDMHQSYRDFEYHQAEYSKELIHTTYTVGELPPPRLVSDIDGPEEEPTIKVEHNESFNFKTNQRLHMRGVCLAKSKLKWLHLKKDLLLKKHWFLRIIAVQYKIKESAIYKASEF